MNPTTDPLPVSIPPSVSLPPFEILSPSGVRLAITPGSADDTVADLATALGFGTASRVCIDGRLSVPGRRLIDTGLRAGSAVTIDGLRRHDADHIAQAGARGGLEVTLTAGPDCRTVGQIGMGRWVVGRSPAAHLRIDDPSVELHHAVVEANGVSVRITQLAGHVPITVDDVPVSSTTTVALPARLQLGNSEVHIARPGARDSDGGCDERSAGPLCGTLTRRSGDPWRREVRRGPSLLPTLGLAPIDVPEPAVRTPIPSAIGLVGAAIAVAGAAVLAAVLGQMMFALFAMIGACASFGTWCVGAIEAWRQTRRSRASAAADRVRFDLELAAHHSTALAHHVAMHTGALDALATTAQLRDDRSGVWMRRLFTGSGDRVDQLRCVIGRGDQRWDVPVAGTADAETEAALQSAGVLSDVPVPLVVEPGRAVAIHGPRTQTSALLRSVLVQLATSVGPADWQLVIVSTEPTHWQWAEWLPHVRDVGNRPRIVRAGDDAALAALFESVVADDLRPTVLVVDDPGMFAVRTGPMRRFIDTVQPATLAAVAPDQTIPAMCDRTVAVGPTGRLRLEEAAAPTDVRDVRLAGITATTAADAARHLAGLADPELDGRHDGRLPTTVSLATVDPALVGTVEQRHRSARRLVERWRAAGSDPAPSTPLGQSGDGIVEIDLERDGPHALIAGTTGSGKSELLRSLVIGLAGQLSPEHLTFVLVDYKGGSTFDACADLPHTVGLVTDLDDGLAERALVSLDAELHRREQLLRAAGASDLAEYRGCADSAPLPRLVVVIDEFAALAKELPDFLSALVGIAQRGRSLGVHLVLATQRPAGVVTDEIRANTNLRLALRLNDAADAHDVVDDPSPTEFTRSIPGRVALRLGPDELIVFQAACCTRPAAAHGGGLEVVAESTGGGAVPAIGDGDRSELEVAVATISDAVRIAGIAAPHRPWIDVLPDELRSHDVDHAVGDIPHDAVGLIDVPVEQGRRPLRWERERGHLALVGSVGSGTTSTLISIITARCRMASPADEQWYVIDARGDHALDGVAGLAHCGAVVRPNERERLHRLLARLVDAIEYESGEADSDTVTVSLAIDGLSSLRLALSSIESAETLALLERVLADGPASGLATCWSDDGTTSSGWASPADTWVFHVGDVDLARSFGVHPVEAGRPGRLRCASNGRLAQVAIGADGMAALPCRTEESGPATIASLPTDVSSADLAAPTDRPGAATTQLVLGLDAHDLHTATLWVPDGDHVFIGGAAATGKSTALRRITDQWLEQHPAATVVEIDRRTRLTADDVAAWPSPMLVVVDDAERVVDPLGVLAGVVNDPPAGVTVVAAARLDAVRSAYGHWARDVARSRCGIIMTSAGDVDGDLLGATLPRRSLIAPRAGLGWAVDSRGHRLVQLATP